VPTVHYVSPSIWAWRGERIHKIKQSVSHILALFPFEAPLYEQAGVPVTYVGHPLADFLPDQPNRAEMRDQMRILPRHAKVFAFLPGSRQSEVRQLAATYIETAKLIL
jgi:lipid-A-disaccharide synthase